MHGCMHAQTDTIHRHKTNRHKTDTYIQTLADWYSKVFLCLQVERLIYLGAGINMYVLTDKYPIFTTMYNHFVHFYSQHCIHHTRAFGLLARRKHKYSYDLQ